MLNKTKSLISEQKVVLDGWELPARGVSIKREFGSVFKVTFELIAKAVTITEDGSVYVTSQKNYDNLETLVKMASRPGPDKPPQGNTNGCESCG